MSDADLRAQHPRTRQGRDEQCAGRRGPWRAKNTRDHLYPAVQLLDLLSFLAESAIATVASLMGEDELTRWRGLLGINTQSVVIPSFSFLPGLVFPGGRLPDLECLLGKRHLMHCTE